MFTDREFKCTNCTHVHAPMQDKANDVIAAPVWQPSKKVRTCTSRRPDGRDCGRKFSYYYRKHHCRACGKVCCHSWSGRHRSMQSKQQRGAAPSSSSSLNLWCVMKHRPGSVRNIIVRVSVRTYVFSLISLNIVRRTIFS